MFDYQTFFKNMSDEQLSAAIILRLMADHGYFAVRSVEALSSPDTKLLVSKKDENDYHFDLEFDGQKLLADANVDYQTNQIVFSNVVYSGQPSHADTMDMLGYWLPKYMPDGVVSPNVYEWYQAIIKKLTIQA